MEARKAAACCKIYEGNRRTSSKNGESEAKVELLA